MKRYRPALISIIILLAAIIAISINFYPDMVKVYFEHPFDNDLKVYLKDDSGNTEKADFTQYHNDTVVVNIKTEDYRQVSRIEIVDEEDYTPIPDTKAAITIGNILFYRDVPIIDGVLEAKDYVVDNKASSVKFNHFRTYFVIFIFVSLILLWLNDGIGETAKAFTALISGNRGLYAHIIITTVIFTVVGLPAVYIYKKIPLFPQLQWTELLASFVTTGIFAGFVCSRVKTIKGRAAAIILGFAGIFIVFCSLTTFFTADEMGAVMEEFRERDFLRHWYDYSSHLNYIWMGTVWKMIDPDKFSLRFAITRYQLAKLVHCFIGLIILIAAVDTVIKDILLDKNNKNGWKKLSDLQIGISYGIMMFMMLILPSITVTLKSYTYDTFSAMLGILAGVLAIIAFRDRNRNYILPAIIISIYATYEKKTAIIVYFVVCGIAAYLGVVGEKKYKAIKYSVISVLLFAGIGLLDQFYYFEYIREGYSPISDPYHSFGRMKDYFPPFAKISGMIGSEGIKGFIAIMIIWIIGITVLGGMLFLGVSIYEKYNINEKRALIVKAGSIIIITYIVLGFAVQFAHIIVPSGLAENTAFIMGNFARYLPTGFVILAAFFAVFNKNYKDDVLYVLALLASSIGMVPAYIYKARWNILWFKYLNMYIGIFALILISVTLPMIFDIRIKKGLKERSYAAVLALTVILQISEIWGSMPAFSYFAPFWYGITTFNLPEEKRELICFAGDNTAVYGQKILDLCIANGEGIDGIMLYPGYDKGWWLTKPEGVEVAPMRWTSNKKEYCSYTEKDFYEIDPHCIMHEEMYIDGWPEAEPVIETYYRGYLTARVYRGSDIKGFFDEDRPK